MSRRKHLARGRRALVVAITLVALVAVGATTWWRTRPAAATTTTTTSVAAALTTQQQTVSSTGTIGPVDEADLSFTTSGTVTDVRVQPGAAVHRGETMATLDPTALQNAVSLAQASLTAAQDQRTAAGAANQSAAQLAAADAQVASDEAKLAAARSALSAATLTTPIDGTVAAVNLTKGSTVGTSGAGSGGSGGQSGQAQGGYGQGGGSAGSSGTGGSSGGSATAGSASAAQVVVIGTTQWKVTTNVGAGDLPTLKKGMEAVVTPVGTNRTLFGTVTSIGMLGSASGVGAATFPVTVTLTGPQTGLYSGTTANVSIVVKVYPDVLTVPTAAITTQNGATVVTEARNGKTVTVPVTVGTVFGATTQITKGLSAGDQVLVTRGSGRPGRGGSGGYGGQRSGGGRGYSGGSGYGGGFGGGSGSAGQGSGR